MARDNEQIFYLGALIFSLVGAILLLAMNFAWFDGSNYYYGVIFYGGVGAGTATYGALFILMAVMLLVCFVISLLALWDADKIPIPQYEKVCFLLSFIVFLLSIIGLIIFGVIAEEEDWYWGPDGGFFGGVIGGLMTMIFFFMIYRENN